MDKGCAKIYGVLGYPAKHSLSPLMHNAAFNYLKINAQYQIFEKRPQELGGFLNSLAEQDIYGLNVTVPYKEKVIAFISKISSEAKLIGAVNTIKVAKDRLEGFNTDGEGFLRHLTQDLKFNPQGKIIAVIGAGGAGRAISVYIAQRNPKAIAIYDIDKPRAQALVDQLKKDFKHIDFKAASCVEELGIRKSDLLVNASFVGMKEADPCLVEGKFIHRDILVYDLIYNPKETKLLKTAKEKDAGISNGLGMLLYQGACAFELWTGRPAPLEVMRQALKEGVEKL